jgi:glycerol kinase
MVSLHCRPRRPGWLLLGVAGLGVASAAGLAAGFWDRPGFVLTHPEGHCITFIPSVTSEESEKMWKHWQEAVSELVDLADLAK